MNPLWAALRTVVREEGALRQTVWHCTFSPITSAPSVLVSGIWAHSPPLPLSYMHPPCPAVIGSRAGRVIPQPERPITFLPPAVYTSALAATPIHYLPRSIAAHSSLLSAASSFSLNPQPWRSAAAQRDTSAINPREDGVLRFWARLITYFGVFLLAIVYVVSSTILPVMRVDSCRLRQVSGRTTFKSSTENPYSNISFFFFLFAGNNFDLRTRCNPLCLFFVCLCHFMDARIATFSIFQTTSSPNTQTLATSTRLCGASDRSDPSNEIKVIFPFFPLSV